MTGNEGGLWISEEWGFQRQGGEGAWRLWNLVRRTVKSPEEEDLIVKGVDRGGEE